LHARTIHGQETDRTATAHELTADGRADTVCVAFFCVRLRGTAGGGWPPVWCSRRRRRDALRSLTPLRQARARNTKKRTQHTAAVDGDAKPPETVAGAGAGATAAAACLRFAARDVRTANALYAAYGNNDDEWQPCVGGLAFTIFKHREESDDGFLFFDSLSFLRTERGDDFAFACYRRYSWEIEVSVSSEANGVIVINLNIFNFFLSEKSNQQRVYHNVQEYYKL